MDYKGVRYYNIPHFERYLVSCGGIIISKDRLEPIKIDAFQKRRGFLVRMRPGKDPDQVRISINEVLMNTFFGLTNLPIVERFKIRENDRECIDVDNLQYDISEFLTIPYNDVDVFSVAGFEYRLISGTKHHTFINEDGAVYSFKNKRFLKRVYGTEDPYPKVTLGSRDGYSEKTISYGVHRLLGETWLPDFKPELFVNHKDGHMYNSYRSNLEMCTPQENVIHASNMGLIKGKAYSEEDIHRVCRYLEKGKTIDELIQKMGWTDDPKISNETVSRLIYRLINGGQWAEITSQYHLSDYCTCHPNTRTVYSDEQIHQICKLLQDTQMTNKEIATKTDTTPYLVQNIRCGAQWKHIRSQYDIEYEVTKTRNSDEVLDHVFKLAARGATKHEIAEKCNVPKKGIRQILQYSGNQAFADKYGFVFEGSMYDNRDKWIPESTIRSICKLIVAGKMNPEISRETGINRQTIDDIRKGVSHTNISIQYGLPNDDVMYSKVPNKYNENDILTICKAIERNPGKTCTEIAQSLNIEFYKVRNVLNRYYPNYQPEKSAS